MTNLTTTTKLVKAILEENEQTRNSDSYLYLKVIEHISEEEGYALEYMSVPFFLENMNGYGFPPFESVRRTRQKIQQTYPHLAACKKVAEQRMVNEGKYRAYAQGVQNV